MKKTLLGALGVAVFGLSGLAAFAETQIKVATLAPPKTPWYAHLETWKNNVAEASGGEIDIQIFPSGQLGTENEMYKQVQRGRMDASAISAGVLSANVPEMALMSTPFLFEKSEVIDCIYDGAFGDELAAVIEGKRFKFLQWQEAGWLNIYAHDDLSDVASAEGYKVRVATSPMSKMLWQNVGANGVELPFSETPAALQSGLVKGGETSVLAYVAFGINKVAPQYTRTRHMHQGGAILISEKTWGSLSAEQQKILTEGLPELNGMRQAVTGLNEHLLQKYKDAGGAVHELSAEQKAAWSSKVEAGWPAFVEGLGPEASAIWPKLLEAKAACSK